MAETVKLRVEVEDDGIIVTLPGTSFRVIYKKQSQYPGLIAFDFRGDKDAGMSLTDFLARAWRIANDKARELGWIGWIV
jgi:hypothetical protein